MSKKSYEEAKRAALVFRVTAKAGDDERDAGLVQPESVVAIRNLLYGPYGVINSLDLFYPKAEFEEDENASSNQLEGMMNGAASAATGTDFTKIEANVPALLTVRDHQGRALRGRLKKKLPVIIDIHGGGWMYGDKELYSHYNMALAGRGFAVVGMNYRLAPEDAFPAAFIDVNRAATWVAANAQKYSLDTDNVFILGDSAGGHLASWYCTLMSSKAYRELYEKSFPIANAHRETLAFTKEGYKEAAVMADKWVDLPAENEVPDEAYHYVVPADKLQVRACALNCGIYDMVTAVNSGNDKAFEYFLGDLLEGETREKTLELIDSWKYQDENFPPAFVMSASYDFLLPQAEPMQKHLQEVGAKAELHVYGSEEQLYMQHVFHVNQKLREAEVCNDDECAYFRQYMI